MKIAVSAICGLAAVLVCVAFLPHGSAQNAPLTLTYIGPQCNGGQLLLTYGQAFSCEIDVSGGTPPYTWNLPSLSSFRAAYPGLSYCISSDPSGACSSGNLIGSRLVIYGVPRPGPNAPGDIKVSIGN